MVCRLQLYLALSAVLASGGQQPMTALQEADAELAALAPDTSKSKVLVLRCLRALASLSSFRAVRKLPCQEAVQECRRGCAQCLVTKSGVAFAKPQLSS